MKKASLNELMGKGGDTAKSRDLTLKDLPAILGDAMPEINKTPVGRLRLVSALRNRFGDQWRNIPGVTGLIKEFDEEAAFNVKLQEMKMIGKSSKGK